MPSEDREVERSQAQDKRASDADRRDIAARLLSAVDEGRLELSEYEERLRRTHEAKTYGELDTIVHDLPEVVSAKDAQLETSDGDAKLRRRREKRKELRTVWAGIGTGAMFFTGIWAIPWIAAGGGAPPYYWPVWVLGFWALGATIYTVHSFFED